MSRGLATAIAVAGGIGLAVQARLNGQLTTELGSPVVVTLLSFLTGLAILVPLVLTRPRTVRFVEVLGPGWRRWWLLAGPYGAFLIVAISAGVPVLGVALVTVLSVAGQTVAGVLLDARGAGTGAVGLSRRRIASVVVAVLGLGVTTLAVPAGTSNGVLLGLGLLLVAAGVASSLQQAANGAIAGAASPTIAALLTFIGGAAVLLVAVAGLGLAGQLNGMTWPGWDRWWLYTGGLLGTAFVVLSAWVVRRIGVLAIALAVVAGQLVGALVLDATTGGPAIRWATVASVGAVLAAVMLALDRRPAEAGGSASETTDPPRLVPTGADSRCATGAAGSITRPSASVARGGQSG